MRGNITEVVRAGFLEEVTPELRPGQPCHNQRRSVPGRGHKKYTGPESGACLAVWGPETQPVWWEGRAGRRREAVGSCGVLELALIGSQEPLHTAVPHSACRLVA